jgi:hypothetical protein
MLQFNHRFTVLLTIIVLILSKPTLSFAQNSPILQMPWIKLEDGLFYCEIDGPSKSIILDSKISILKIEPKKFDFQLLTSSEYDNILRSADCWAEEFQMQITVNAGMYSPNKTLSNKGYLKNYNHINNNKLSGYYNAMMTLNPKDTTENPFEIHDFTCNSWDKLKNNYHSFCQGMRMIDCGGNAMAWDKRPGQSCSMVVSSTDIDGNIYFAFCASPYTHQAMINFLLSLPIQFRTTIYLEGGPEASLYIQTPDTIISKWGTYVSSTWEHADNDHFWEIPNVIGIKKKK